ncbi:MAG: helix-turn-helix domain-containing protein [Actinomycetota bacterium]|nr:helix-turn-helix domain-containing protein [Actinomycetota bacterium]
MGEKESKKLAIDWMSSKEVAAYLGVSLQTLYKFIDDGSLAAYHMGRVIRLRHEDVLEFLKGQRIAKGELNQLLRRKEPTDIAKKVDEAVSVGRTQSITAAHNRAKLLLQEERERILKALEEIDRALSDEDFDDDYVVDVSDETSEVMAAEAPDGETTEAEANS